MWNPFEMRISNPFKRRPSVYDELVAGQRKLFEKEFSDDPPEAREVLSYMDRVKRAGRHIGGISERDQMRAFLRYWAKYVYRETGVYPSTDLLERENADT